MSIPTAMFITGIVLMVIVVWFACFELGMTSITYVLQKHFRMGYGDAHTIGMGVLLFLTGAALAATGWYLVHHNDFLNLIL